MYEYVYKVDELEKLFRVMAALPNELVNINGYLGYRRGDLCESPRCLAGQAAIDNLLPSLRLKLRAACYGPVKKEVSADNFNSFPYGTAFTVTAGNQELAANFDSDMFATLRDSYFDIELIRINFEVKIMLDRLERPSELSKIFALYRILRAAGYSPATAETHAFSSTWPNDKPEGPPRLIMYGGTKLP